MGTLLPFLHVKICSLFEKLQKKIKNEKGHRANKQSDCMMALIGIEFRVDPALLFFHGRDRRRNKNWDFHGTVTEFPWNIVVLILVYIIRKSDVKILYPESAQDFMRTAEDFDGMSRKFCRVNSS